jgi:hypothetical protein
VARGASAQPLDLSSAEVISGGGHRGTC